VTAGDIVTHRQHRDEGPAPRIHQYIHGTASEIRRNQQSSYHTTRVLAADDGHISRHIVEKFKKNLKFLLGVAYKKMHQ
jgi:hypothetical protein